MSPAEMEAVRTFDEWYRSKQTDGIGLDGLKFVLVSALSLDLGVLGFPSVRIPFPRNANPSEKLFLRVFGHTDVGMYLFVHFVTS